MIFSTEYHLVAAIKKKGTTCLPFGGSGTGFSSFFMAGISVFFVGTSGTLK